LFATGVVYTGGKFAAGVVDTGGIFAAVSLIPVVHLDLRISPRISKKFKTVLIKYSGAEGKLIHAKNQKLKISPHCPFKVIFLGSLLHLQTFKYSFNTCTIDFLSHYPFKILLSS
jgi:hypothetical protein